jgi:hypothetical protein
LRTTGAIASGNIAGIEGRFPVVSSAALVNSKIACWPLVTLYRLHIRWLLSLHAAHPRGNIDPRPIATRHLKNQTYGISALVIIDYGYA